MGNNVVSSTLDRRSTAIQVIQSCGQGQYLKGKVAIVTGGNTGIGLETCKALLSAGCKVYLCSRSKQGGLNSIEEEIKTLGKGNYNVDPENYGNILVSELDLNDLNTVKKFAQDFLKVESRLDLLVLNAGIMATPKREVTAQGFEKQLGVNHFGHSYLTNLLKPLMIKQDFESRIVCLSSVAHSMSDIDFDDFFFESKRTYKPMVVYGQSKLCNLLYAKALANKLKDTKITAVSVHPGVIATGLWNNYGFVVKTLANAFIMDKNIPQGAATTIYACVHPRISNPDMRGAYLVDCAPALPKTAIACDANNEWSNKLYDFTEEQLKLKFNK